MPPPKKGEPGYVEFRQAYNDRRRRRRQDPEYRARELERWAVQKGLRTEERERRHDKEG